MIMVIHIKRERMIRHDVWRLVTLNDRVNDCTAATLMSMVDSEGLCIAQLPHPAGTIRPVTMTMVDAALLVLLSVLVVLQQR